MCEALSFVTSTIDKGSKIVVRPDVVVDVSNPSVWDFADYRGCQTMAASFDYLLSLLVHLTLPPGQSFVVSPGLSVDGISRLKSTAHRIRSLLVNTQDG